MHEKVLRIFKKACNEDNWFLKEENDTINKWAIEVACKDKNLLYLEKKMYRKVR